jgi:lysozyme
VKISAKGLDLIKLFEGFRPKAYLCPAGVLTIGYGSTGRHVTRGMVLSEAEAAILLDTDLDRFEHAVDQLASRCTQGQFDALVSFAFNCGVGNLKISSILANHKTGKASLAAASFAKWNKARVNGVLTPLAGLTRRRAAEAALYLS